MEFDQFLKEAAQRLGLQWRPFKKDGIKRRLERRIIEIGCSSFEQYLEKMDHHPEEQDRLSQILTVTISRFFRDREVFEILKATLIPNLLKNKDKKRLKMGSIGCASGEEPYSLSLLWKEVFEKDHPEIQLSIIATDINGSLLERARQGTYKESSLKEAPDGVRRNFFNRVNGLYVLGPEVRKSVDFRRHNILGDEPFPETDILSCRNCAFTYFSKESQNEVLKRIAGSLRKEGYLIIGKEELLPLTYPTLFVPIFPREKIFQKFKMDDAD
jgi:chemotaxis methyl-accepting protein methylase